MNEQELKKLENDVKNRIKNALGCNQETADFIVNMTASFHSTRGGALYQIDDYMNRKGL